MPASWRAGRSWRLLDRAGEEAADEIGLFGYVHQESVVPVIGFELDVSYVAIARPQRAHDLLRLVTGVEPVRAEADHQEPRLPPLERGRQRAEAVGEIEIIHGLGDVEVRVGVEAVDE